MRSPYPQIPTHGLRLLLLSILLAAVITLLGDPPVYGRWSAPSTLPPPQVNLARYLPPEELDRHVLYATPTPILLPDQARVPILMYHYISELPPDADQYRRNLTVTPANFEAQLQYLAEAGYHTISLPHLYQHLTAGRPLPTRPIVLTFDDGYRDAYEVAFPLLQKYGFVGTFFVLATPAHFEDPNYLTWAHIKEMADAGMEIQGHGRDHVDLRHRSYGFLVYQILGIKEAVEAHTGRPVRFFCYPSGQCDADVIAVLKSAGYWGAVTTEWGTVHTRDRLFTMSRVRISGQDTLEDFIEKVTRD